ncbi:MAG: response regulator transcription factor, partial [Burkholderiaceae bacterium]
MTIKVLLADDHALVRTGFKLLLQASADIEVVAEAESGEEAYRLFVEQHPDVVIMDLAMPGIGGIEAVK